MRLEPEGAATVRLIAWRLRLARRVQLSRRGYPTGLVSYAVLTLLFARVSGVAQPVSSSDVYVFDYYEEVLRPTWVC